MKNYLTEFIGTFFLVLTVCLTAGVTQFAPLAIGASLMIMVYMGGHVSGGHYNPAVTTAVCLRGKMNPADVIPYWLSQLAGSIAAAAVAVYLSGKLFGGCAPGEGVNVMQAVVNELIFTFALALVVLNAATAKATANNSFYGLAIGFTVVVGAFAGGAISGGAYNPAVGTGPLVYRAIAGGGPAVLSHVWIYWVGPLAGGCLAALVFKLQNED